jgi:hypothetical protein
MRSTLVVLVVFAAAGCTRNRTPAAPGLIVKSGGSKVSGAVMIGQPLTLVADWAGTCERHSIGDAEDPGNGSWSKGTCNEVTSFNVDVKCSLACQLGKQTSDTVRNTVSRDVIPQEAGNLELEVFYRSPWHHDRRLTYAVTVLAPKSVALLGCGNQKQIPLDALVLGPPGTAQTEAPSSLPPSFGPGAMEQRILCTKVDPEAEGALRIAAITTDDRKLPLPMEVNGDVVMQLTLHDIEKLRDPSIADGLYPLRIFVMGKPVDLMIDVRARMQR